MESSAGVMRGVFSARPGMAILTFWQGTAEMILRVNAIALGCSVIAASTLSVYYCNGCELFFPKYLGSAALLMFVAIAVVLYQVAIIVVRFLNLNCVNAFSKVAFVIDICSNLVLAAFVTTGVSIFTPILVEIEQRNLLLPPWTTTLSVCSFILLFDLTHLALWMVLFLCMKWNNQLVQHAPGRDHPDDDQTTLTVNAY